MDKVFQTQSHANEKDDHWLSLSDLMAGLMMVFLLIALLFMLTTQKEEGKIREIAVAYQENQASLYEALHEEFKNDLEKWGANIDKETLAINFQSPDVLFAHNMATLTEAYKAILDDFFPRYIEILKPFRESLNEIRIEGHTSSRAHQSFSEDQAYFYNMRLSQSRTRAVLEYGYDLMPEEKSWIKANIAAVGFSSSRLVLIDGVEDEAKSRRVSFRAITNSEIQIKRILEEE